MNNFPFNRELINSEGPISKRRQIPKGSISERKQIIAVDLNQYKSIVTITGQFITEAWKFPAEPYHYYHDEAFPQTFKEAYLIRYELEKLSESILTFLIREKNRSFEEIVKAAQIVRDEIWRHWSDGVAYYKDNEDGISYTDYFTGSEAEEIGPKSYRIWSLTSEIILDDLPDDWLKQDIWLFGESWKFSEIEAVIALWCIDEAALYVNLGQPYKAAIWLNRANSSYYFMIADDVNSDAVNSRVAFNSRIAFENAMKKIANDPKTKEKEFVKECWLAWQKEPSQYTNNTKFASAMIDKLRPDDPADESKNLSSVKVIADWCRGWKAEK